MLIYLFDYFLVVKTYFPIFRIFISFVKIQLSIISRARLIQLSFPSVSFHLMYVFEAKGVRKKCQRIYNKNSGRSISGPKTALSHYLKRPGTNFNSDTNRRQKSLEAFSSSEHYLHITLQSVNYLIRTPRSPSCSSHCTHTIQICLQEFCGILTYLYCC